MYSVNEHLLIEFRTPFRIANEKSITTIGARENCCIFPGFCWILLTANVMNLLILSEVCDVVTNSNTEIVCFLLISLQTAEYKNGAFWQFNFLCMLPVASMYQIGFFNLIMFHIAT